MKKLLIGAAVCLSLCCSSCALSRQATDNRNITQTQVVLAKNNYKVVGQVYAESAQNYWFVFGGMSKKSLGESAMSELYKNADLKGAQAVINVNVSYKVKNILIYNQVKAIATGTVIEFTE